MNKQIEIKNATIHNLKGIDVSIPKQKLTVITGVSGSGKSSLAFDTLYEEGKRRYLMFSGTQLAVENTTHFDSITGLSPTVAVEQRIIRQSNPRSTVGTRTKISTLIAALFTNFGETKLQLDAPLEISMFQKNSPKGMCVKCLGKGSYLFIHEDALFADSSKRLVDVCLGLGQRGSTREQLQHFCNEQGLDLWNTRLSDLTQEQLEIFKYGADTTSAYQGFIPWINLIIGGAFSTSGRLPYLMLQAGLLENRVCPKCKGTGLGSMGAFVTYGGKTITELEDMYVSDLLGFIEEHGDRTNPLVKEILSKLSCMVDVGLHHLALSRTLPTLSGGEIQRLFLASYMIAQMDSIIFVFDEPTVGLHESEKERLSKIIRELIAAGNTVVAVEHDENFIREADYLIDIGPEAGVNGGIKIYEGGYESFLNCKGSKTAPYLTLQNGFPIKKEYRIPKQEHCLSLKNVSVHNLQGVTVKIPLGVMVGVAGVSGSGKSSLISDFLVPKLKDILKNQCVTDEDETEAYEAAKGSLLGAEQIKKCYVIDQKPIGRSRTSCPATYTGIFDRVRQLFAETEKAKALGYSAGLFSVNSEGGCKKCKGDGVVHYHVGFGNFIDVECEACNGTGYIKKAMEITIEGKTICDVLCMSVEEAYEFFQNKDASIERILRILRHVGMGYIKLGQATPTISGGESQRIKLAKELSKGKSKNALYILDEPTTGLSFYDSEKLLHLINELVDAGNSVILIEHDPYILSNCDHIIEMGPGGGREGGQVLAEGTPTQLIADKKSIIGKYLKRSV